jgi:tellurite resistance protein
MNIIESWSGTIQCLNEDRTKAITALLVALDVAENEGAITEHEHVLALQWMKKYVDR